MRGRFEGADAHQGAEAHDGTDMYDGSDAQQGADRPAAGPPPAALPADQLRAAQLPADQLPAGRISADPAPPVPTPPVPAPTAPHPAPAGHDPADDIVCPSCETPLPGVTERLRDALRAGESRFRAAFADAGIGMALVDADDCVIEANPALAAMVGLDVSELVRKHIHQFIDPEERARRLYRELVAGDRDRLRIEKQLKHRDGHTVWTNITVSLIRDGDGNPLYTLAMVEDVTEQRRLGDRLQYQSLHDPLTRLPNRSYFFERLAAACEAPAAARRRVGLCYVDLDGFAAVNDTLGHHIGDELLVAVAARLEQRFARGGGRLVARLGGDEFALLVPDSEGDDQLTGLAEELLRVLDQPFDVAGHRLAVTASIGVVERPVRGTTPTELVKDADATLYWSKADGRARWTLYDPDRGAHQMTRQLLATALRPALERGEFAVEFQPLVGLADGRVHGAEALVRWRHPRFGTLSPDRFIPLAEETGAIVPLGKWVLEESCRQARHWLDEFPAAGVFVSVNLAVRQVWDSDVVADVAEVLDRTGLPARLLQLELTESAVMGPAGRPLQALQALADMGVRIAIDDFGTGYSNLAYLSRLPVHVLKLDGTFVEGFRDPGGTRRDADEKIVSAMVRLAHALGLTVTAEGIESAVQAERLRATGCDTAQGWYFARPGPPHRVVRMLREGPWPAGGPADPR